jgi:hypothetical protein
MSAAAGGEVTPLPVIDWSLSFVRLHMYTLLYAVETVSALRRRITISPSLSPLIGSSQSISTMWNMSLLRLFVAPLGKLESSKGNGAGGRGRGDGTLGGARLDKLILSITAGLHVHSPAHTATVCRGVILSMPISEYVAFYVNPFNHPPQPHHNYPPHHHHPIRTTSLGYHRDAR